MYLANCCAASGPRASPLRVFAVCIVYFHYTPRRLAGATGATAFHSEQHHLHRRIWRMHAASSVPGPAMSSRRGRPGHWGRAGVTIPKVATAAETPVHRALAPAQSKVIPAGRTKDLSAVRKRGEGLVRLATVVLPSRLAAANRRYPTDPLPRLSSCGATPPRRIHTSAVVKILNACAWRLELVLVVCHGNSGCAAGVRLDSSCGCRDAAGRQHR